MPDHPTYTLSQCDGDLQLLRSHVRRLPLDQRELAMNAVFTALRYFDPTTPTDETLTRRRRLRQQAAAIARQIRPLRAQTPHAPKNKRAAS